MLGRSPRPRAPPKVKKQGFEGLPGAPKVEKQVFERSTGLLENDLFINVLV